MSNTVQDFTTRTWSFFRGDVVKHVKSGNVYVVTNHVLLENGCTPAYAYIALDCENFALHQPTWVREATEFEDGRFMLGGFRVASEWMSLFCK